jgi:hypothetical protein
MNKLSKEKRNHLILAVATIVLLLTGIYFTLIRYQQGGLVVAADRKATTDKKMSEIRDSIKNSRQIEAELLVVSNKLALQEEDMPSGDLYASMVNTLRKFKLGHQVEIPQFNSPGTAVDVTLLPKFPYKQVVITIIGTAYYQDLGKFIADYENEFPTSRIQNLDLSPASVQSANDKEKLAFKLELVSLVKGSTPVTTPKL